MSGSINRYSSQDFPSSHYQQYVEDDGGSSVPEVDYRLMDSGNESDGGLPGDRAEVRLVVGSSSDDDVPPSPSLNRELALFMEKIESGRGLSEEDFFNIVVSERSNCERFSRRFWSVPQFRAFGNEMPSRWSATMERLGFFTQVVYRGLSFVALVGPFIPLSIDALKGNDWGLQVGTAVAAGAIPAIGTALICILSQHCCNSRYRVRDRNENFQLFDRLRTFQIERHLGRAQTVRQIFQDIFDRRQHRVRGKEHIFCLIAEYVDDCVDDEDSGKEIACILGSSPVTREELEVAFDSIRAFRFNFPDSDMEACIRRDPCCKRCC